ncbi:hypothetical protein B0H16DRAFT_1711418 [Mycena metata]|uniref:Secreted protein n=1 Tax=Mycena metata TaxID=1033252 RepID=A0AAD7K612_9AGAR|nr:hypothetical protein B0H16DRAFT_1711418 [Mycena metata]
MVYLRAPLIVNNIAPLTILMLFVAAIPRAPASAAYVNPNSPYSVCATGPPLSAWTSPRTTVLQYANGRLQFDDNGRYPSHNPYYSNWPYFGWYPPAGSGWGSSC